LDNHARAHLSGLAREGRLAVERAAPDREVTWTGTARSVPLDGAAHFERLLDLAWRRLSYTGITAGLRHADDGPGVPSEPEETGLTDEPGTDEIIHPGAEVGGTDGERLRALRSLWNDLPAGASFGTLVHEVLEHVDTSVDDLAGEVRSACEQRVARRLTWGTDPQVLAQALMGSLQTPLGHLGHGFRLRDVARRDRLAELAFELPLAGGDRERRERARVADLAGLLREHLAPEDPLAAYPDLLASEGLGERSLGGYLVGSIDAVLRLRPDSGHPSYLVVDYKTNVVRTGDAGLSAWDYQPDRLAPVMMAAHYPLQALLYSVGLHRFLRWRQPGYDCATHLGGVLYLFLRGMVGPDGVDDRGRPCGVFSWRPSAALVTEASDLLAGGAT
jgi:exodeoxyribonuclease V beta subunit